MMEEENPETRTTQRSSLQTGRKHPVHQAVRTRHNEPTIVFLTVCTKDRKQILATDRAHRILLLAWDAADQWKVGRYVIMPDHVHLFCAPTTLPPTELLRWVSYWKSYAARRWPESGDAPVWQRHFWDTQLRRLESYDAKSEYVRQNPLRHGLVERSEDWAYQGESHILPW